MSELTIILLILMSAGTPQPCAYDLCVSRKDYAQEQRIQRLEILLDDLAAQQAHERRVLAVQP